MENEKSLKTQLDLINSVIDRLKLLYLGVMMAVVLTSEAEDGKTGMEEMDVHLDGIKNILQQRKLNVEEQLNILRKSAQGDKK